MIALRILSGLGWQWFTFPVMIVAFFGGQFLGAKIYAGRQKAKGPALESGA